MIATDPGASRAYPLALLVPLRRHWLLILVVMAATALAVVVVLNFTTGEKEVDESIPRLYGIDDPQFLRAMGVLLGPPIVGGNRYQELRNGDEIFPAVLAAIAAARRSITFETYIYWSGDIGRRFADALSERARAGVKVHVLLDWLGSQKIDPALIDEMTRAGVQVRFYHPLRWYDLARLNNRTHRKVLVVDGRIGFTGGVGIAPEWTGRAQVFMSSPTGGSESMHLMYLLAITAAQRSIDLAMAYFVPDELAVKALRDALARGVKVRIIAPGPITDTETVRKASRALWGPLLQAGAEFYEYQPTMYHCKVMVVDGLLTSVGSTNFDNRSFRLNDEANLNIYDAAFAQRQIAIFEDDRAQSRPFTYEDWRNRPLREKLLEEVASVLRLQL